MVTRSISFLFKPLNISELFPLEINLEDDFRKFFLTIVATYLTMVQFLKTAKMV